MTPLTSVIYGQIDQTMHQTVTDRYFRPIKVSSNLVRFALSLCSWHTIADTVLQWTLRTALIVKHCKLPFQNLRLNSLCRILQTERRL